MKDLCTVGDMAIDYLICVSRFAKPDGLPVYVDHFTREYGGLAGNIAVISKGLGLTVGILGCMGNDIYGKLYTKYLKELNIDTTHMHFIDGPTSRCFLLSNDKKRQRETFFYSAAEKPILNINKKWINGYKMVYLCSKNPATCIEVVKTFEGILVFDSGPCIDEIHKDDLRKIFTRANIIFIRDSERNIFFRKIGLSKSGFDKKIYDKIVINTHGKRGSVIHFNGKKIYIPALGGEKGVHISGVGEGYRAAFLAAYLKGRSLEKCGKIAAITASTVMKESGAQTVTPSWIDIENEIEKLEKNGII